MIFIRPALCLQISQLNFAGKLTSRDLMSRDLYTNVVSPLNLVGKFTSRFLTSRDLQAHLKSHQCLFDV